MAIRLLPCKHCGHARTKPNRRFPSGEPLAVGSVGSFPIVYSCAGCRWSYKIDAGEWNRLPPLADEDLRELGFGYLLDRVATL